MAGYALRANPTASESTAAVVVPSPRSGGERAAQIFQQGLMGEGFLSSKSTRQDPLTRHSLPKVRAALSPQERGEGTNTATALWRITLPLTPPPPERSARHMSTPARP